MDNNKYRVHTWFGNRPFQYKVIFLFIIFIAIILRFSWLSRDTFDVQEQSYFFPIIEHDTTLKEIFFNKIALSLGHPPGSITTVLFFLKKINFLKLSYELLFRLQSALSGVGLVIVIYLLALRLFSERKTALLSAFFVAISPYLTYYSRSCEPYSLLSVLAALNYYFFVTLFLQNTPSRIKYISFILINIIAFHISYFSVFIIAAELITVLILFKKKLILSSSVRLFLWAIMIIFLLLAAYIPLLCANYIEQIKLMAKDEVREIFYPKTYWPLYYSEILRTYLGFPLFLAFLAPIGLLLVLIYFPIVKKNISYFAIFLFVLLSIILCVSILYLLIFAINIGKIYPLAHRHHSYFVSLILIYMAYVFSLKSPCRNSNLYKFKNTFIIIWIMISLLYSSAFAFSNQRPDINRVIDYFNQNFKNAKSCNIFILNPIYFSGIFYYYFNKYCTVDYHLYPGVPSENNLAGQAAYAIIPYESIFGQSHFYIEPSVNIQKLIKNNKVFLKKIRFPKIDMYIFNMSVLQEKEKVGILK